MCGSKKQYNVRVYFNNWLIKIETFAADKDSIEEYGKILHLILFKKGYTNKKCENNGLKITLCSNNETNRIEIEEIINLDYSPAVIRLNSLIEHWRD